MILYEITEEMLQLQEMLSDPDTDPEVVTDTLESVKYEFEKKAESYAKIIRNMESESDAYKKESERLRNKSIALNNGVMRLKNTLKTAMEVTGVKKCKGDLFTVSVQKNGGVQPIVVTCEAEALPDEFVKVTKEPDREKIRKSLSEGNKLPFAYLEERGTSLRIK